MDHIERCLEELQHARHLAADPDAVEVALWFHDAVCDPAARDSEARSARLADDALADAGVDAGRRAGVSRLILATRHDGQPLVGDAALVADIDLAILGADADAFDRYEAAVRREYAALPDAAFYAGRAAILRRFLERRSIYATDPFRTRYEARARTNLTRSLARSVPAPATPRTPLPPGPNG
jgi:predicted metal-dependent HD superfamily phosphohydrolase